MNIDLHIHTTFSDGSLSPREVLALARKRDLAAISITDHDAVGGSREMLALDLSGIRFLPGVEITAEGPPDAGLPDSLHILGYGIDVDSPELGSLLEQLQAVRDDRTPLILERLAAIGLPVTSHELADAFSGPQVGRPHIAQIMVKKGYVSSVDEAFDRYLGKGQPAYVDKFRVSWDQAMAVIRNAGGIPVLAHPYLCDLSDEGMDALVRTLMAGGLRGIEVYYSEHSEAQTRFYEALAARYDLIATGGSDFHGDAVPGIELGCGRGNLAVPYALFEKLLEAL